jgi:hypothetical protein
MTGQRIRLQLVMEDFSCIAANGYRLKESPEFAVHRTEDQTAWKVSDIETGTEILGVDCHSAQEAIERAREVLSQKSQEQIAAARARVVALIASAAATSPNEAPR